MPFGIRPFPASSASVPRLLPLPLPPILPGRAAPAPAGWGVAAAFIRRAVGLALLLCLALCCTACARHGSLGPTWNVLRSGELSVRGGPDIEPAVYADVRRNRKLSGILRSAIANRLSAAGFAMTDTPSRAGYILHVNVPAAGEGDAASAGRAADAGFAGAAILAGAKSSVIVADILLVERRVPEARRERIRDMRSIGRRNAVADSRMRLVLHQPGIARGAGLMLAAANALAQEICRPLERPIPPATAVAPADTSPSARRGTDGRKAAAGAKSPKKPEDAAKKPKTAPESAKTPKKSSKGDAGSAKGPKMGAAGAGTPERPEGTAKKDAKKDVGKPGREAGRPAAGADGADGAKNPGKAAGSAEKAGGKAKSPEASRTGR